MRNRGFAVLGVAILLLIPLFFGFTASIIAERSELKMAEEKNNLQIVRHEQEDLDLHREGDELIIKNNGSSPSVLEGLLLINKKNKKLTIKAKLNHEGLNKEQILLQIRGEKSISLSNINSNDKILGVYTTLGNKFFEGR